MNATEFIDTYTGSKEKRFELIKDAFQVFERSTCVPNNELLNVGLRSSAEEFARYLYEKSTDDVSFWYEMKLHFHGADNIIKYASRGSDYYKILSTYNLRRFFEHIIGPEAVKNYGRLKKPPSENQVPRTFQDMGRKGELFTKEMVTRELFVKASEGSKVYIYEIPNCSATPDLLIFDDESADDLSLFDSLVNHCRGVVEVKSSQLKDEELTNPAPNNRRQLFDLLDSRTRFKGVLLTSKRYKPIPYWMSSRDIMNDLHVPVEEMTVHDGKSLHHCLDAGNLWINLVGNPIGRQILGQLMSVASAQRYRKRELTAYLSLVFCVNSNKVAYAVCLRFKVNCELLEKVNEDIGTRIFDADIAEMARKYLSSQAGKTDDDQKRKKEILSTSLLPAFCRTKC